MKNQIIATSIVLSLALVLFATISMGGVNAEGQGTTDTSAAAGGNMTAAGNTTAAGNATTVTQHPNQTTTTATNNTGTAQ